MKVIVEREDQTTTGLLDWIEEPSSVRGIRFCEDDGRWTLYPYAELAQRVRRAAGAIEAARAHPGGSVALILPTGPEFVVAFFGALLAGDTPCPLAPPGFLQDPLEYRRYTAEILGAAHPSLLLSTPELMPSALDGLAHAGLSATPVTASLDTSGAADRCAAISELGLLQFTSGSSGRPRGARVTHENLIANIAMIRRWVKLERDDVVVSWLPLFHDMGLIGALLTTLTTGVELLIMRPDQFIRSPMRWLDCLGSGPATMALSPTFGFAYARRRIAADRLAGSDFSRWRVALVAAERIDPGVLGAFASLLSPYGFRAEAFLPAYGLAEATLAVTGGELDRPPAAVHVELSELCLERPVQLRGRARVGDHAPTSGSWLVSCGRAHPGLRLEILSERRTPLAEGHLGEIAVAGPTIVDGYQGENTAGSSAITPDRQLRTGDAGFLLDGELYVVGRIGDSLKVRGRSLYMEDIESRLGRIPGVSAGRCVAMAGRSANGDCLVALVEADEGPWIADVAALLEHAVGGELEVGILQGARGTIQRTSSGKPRRRVMWRALLEGRLQARCVLRRAPRLAEAPALEPSPTPAGAGPSR